MTCMSKQTIDAAYRPDRLIDSIPFHELHYDGENPRLVFLLLHALNRHSGQGWRGCLVNTLRCDWSNLLLPAEAEYVEAASVRRGSEFERHVDAARNTLEHHGLITIAKAEGPGSELHQWRLTELGKMIGCEADVWTLFEAASMAELRKATS